LIPKKKNTKKTGDKGEQLAVDFLIKAGYSILDRNFRSGKSEIDIIAELKDFIVFIEVKTRSEFQNNNPGDLLSHAQQNRITNAAHDYIITKDIDLEARFDLMIVVLEQGNKTKIEHIEDAFYATQ
jgi:putative endonuclease